MSVVADYLEAALRAVPADPVTINEQGQMDWPHALNDGADGSSSDFVTATPDTRPQFRRDRRMPDQTQQRALARTEGGHMNWTPDPQEMMEPENNDDPQSSQATERPLANIMAAEAAGEQAMTTSPASQRVERYLTTAEEWSQGVSESRDRHTPPGTFDGEPEEIVKKIVRFAGGDHGLASRETNFYLQREGKGGKNEKNVRAAEEILKKHNSDK